MDRSSSLEKEKKNITHFLPKALIEEINKSCDDKNHNKPPFPPKEKEINIKPNPNININTSINGIHNGFSFNNKNMNFLNSSYQNINISNISYNKLNMNNIHSQSIINNNTNHNTINLNHSQNISGKALNSNINNNMQKYLNDINKINGINGIKNGINGLNGNNIFKNGNSFINSKNGYQNELLNHNNINNINNLNQINFSNNNIYGNFNKIQNYNSFLDNTINNSINIHLILPNENNYVNKPNYQYNTSNHFNTINNINNNFISNNSIEFNNNNFSIINENELSKSFNSNNINNIYKKLNLNNNIYPINNINNQINNFNKINLNNLQNSINNNNENIINQKMEQESEKNISETDLIDPQIEEIFSEIYNLPSDKSQILYLINKKGPDFFIKLIKTHKGSKHLQKMLSNNKLKEYEVNYITDIICKNFLSIICDYYGNYFLQKFFKFCSNKNRLDIYKLIKPNFKQIANDICGNHSLQCLILLQNSKEERRIIKECIINDLPFLCFNQKSSHVIQKVIKAIKEKDREYLNNFIINHLIDLCIDANGICIIKEFMNNIKNQYYVLFIINAFENNLDVLVTDQFGNFGIQEAIKLFGFYRCVRIIDTIISNLLFYSLKKYSSNVIVFILNYLKSKNFSKLLQVIKIIFNENYICNNNNVNNNSTSCKKNKKKSKNTIYQKLVSNQFAIYIIFTIIQILNEVNKDFLKKIVNNEKYVNNNNDMEDSDDKEDEKNSEESKNYNKEKSEENDNINYVNNCNNIPFEEFEKYKKGILLYIENNTQNKFKKKLLNLMKTNKIENNFITLKKSEK
jgi:hypothetical protein